MTTVVYQNDNIAVDGLMTNNNIIESTTVKKIFQSDGYVISGCGSPRDIQVVHRWLLGNAKKPDTLSNHAEMVVITKRQLVIINSDMTFLELSKDDVVTMGSGWLVAKSLTMLGLPVEEVIKKTCEIDVYSGGEISSVMNITDRLIEDFDVIDFLNNAEE